ncbi:hypothetical protein E2542_SST01660 [Spatholobus suberectus]|nr:hypothetical protein E2542_SST01660 [Spatholobus suberectus]
MLIPRIPSLLLLRKKKFMTRMPSTSTWHCFVKFWPIAKNSPPLPPIPLFAPQPIGYSQLFPAVVPLPRVGSYTLLTRLPLETPLPV